MKIRHIKSAAILVGACTLTTMLFCLSVFGDDRTADGDSSDFIRFRADYHGAEELVRFSGQLTDSVIDIALDPQGELLILGVSGSRSISVAQSVQRPYAIDGWMSRCPFIAKVSPSGEIRYLSFLGGDFVDEPAHIAAGADGRCYFAGGSMSAEFPTTPGAYQETVSGWIYDSFVACFDQFGDLVYSTLLTDAGLDIATAIAVDSLGSAYVAGFSIDLFGLSITHRIVRVSPSGSSARIVEEIVLPEMADFQILDMALSPSEDHLVAVGYTGTHSLPFPISEIGRGGGRDILVMRVPISEAEQASAVVIGGQADDAAASISFRFDGRVQVAGYVASETLSDVLKITPLGDVDAFVAIFASELDDLELFQVLGGSNKDEATAVCALPDGRVIVAGASNSEGFPVGSEPFWHSFLSILTSLGEPIETISVGEDLTRVNAIACSPNGTTFIGGVDGIHGFWVDAQFTSEGAGDGIVWRTRLDDDDTAPLDPKVPLSPPILALEATILEPGSQTEWEAGAQIPLRIDANQQGPFYLFVEYSSDDGLNWNEIGGTSVAEVPYLDYWYAHEVPIGSFLVRITLETEDGANRAEDVIELALIGLSPPPHDLGEPRNAIEIGGLRFDCDAGFFYDSEEGYWLSSGEVSISDTIYFLGDMWLSPEHSFVGGEGQVELRGIPIINTLQLFESDTYLIDVADFQASWRERVSPLFDIAGLNITELSASLTFNETGFGEFVLQSRLLLDPIASLEINPLVITSRGIESVHLEAEVKEIPGTGFAIENLTLDYRQRDEQLDMHGVLHFPKPSEMTVEGELTFLRGTLDRIDLVADNLDFMLYAGTPAVWAERFGGGIRDLQTGAPIFRGEALLSFSPAIGLPKTVFLDAEFELDPRGTIIANAGIHLLDPEFPPLAEGDLQIGHDGGFARGKATLGPLVLEGSVIAYDGAFAGRLSGTVEIDCTWFPEGPVQGAACTAQALMGYEGRTIRVDLGEAILLNDTIGFEVIVPLPDSLNPLGLIPSSLSCVYTTDRSYVEGTEVLPNVYVCTNITKLRTKIERLADGQLGDFPFNPFTRSLLATASPIDSGTLYAEFNVREESVLVEVPSGLAGLRVEASWDKGAMDFALIAPDGSSFSPGASNVGYAYVGAEAPARSAVAWIREPIPGNWRVVPTNVSNTSECTIAASGELAEPTVEITAVRSLGGDVYAIKWQATASDSASLIVAVSSEPDALLGDMIGTATIEGPDNVGEFIWDTNGVTKDLYFVRAIIHDRRNPPVSCQWDEAVVVSSGSSQAAPQNLFAAMGKDGLVVSWEHDRLSQSTAGYVVFVRHSGAPIAKQYAVTGSRALITDALLGGEYEIRVAAYDQQNTLGTKSEELRYTVPYSTPNTTPKLVLPEQRMASVGFPYCAVVSAVDASGAAIRFSAEGSPEGLTIHEASGTISWTPALEQTGIQSVTILAMSERGKQARGSFAINVAAPPQVLSGGKQTPLAVDDFYMIDRSAEIPNFLALETGILSNDHVSLTGGTIEVVSPPRSGQISEEAGLLTYMHSGGSAAYDRFTYKVVTGGVTATATVHITIRPEIGGGNQSSSADDSSQSVFLSVSPNPSSNDAIAFDFATPSWASSAVIILAASDGRQYFRWAVDLESHRFPEIGQVSLRKDDGNRLPRGEYVCILQADSSVVATVRLVLE